MEQKLMEKIRDIANGEYHIMIELGRFLKEEYPQINGMTTFKQIKTEGNVIWMKYCNPEKYKLPETIQETIARPRKFKSYIAPIMQQWRKTRLKSITKVIEKELEKFPVHTEEYKIKNFNFRTPLEPEKNIIIRACYIPRDDTLYIGRA